MHARKHEQSARQYAIAIRREDIRLPQIALSSDCKISVSKEAGGAMVKICTAIF